MGDHLVAIPCYNHQRTVSEVVRGALRHVAADRIVVVDDGSVPPLQPAHVSGAVLLRHERNRGLSAAIATAVGHALAIGADGLIKLDADGQMDTEALPRFRAALDQGYELVLGTFDAARTPTLELFADGLFRLLFRLGTGCSVPTVLADYRAYGPDALRVLAAETTTPPWASPLTLFYLRSLPWCPVDRCIGFVGRREFPPAGMLQLRVTFMRYLVRERSVRAVVAMPVAAAALFAHLGCVLVGRAVSEGAARVRAVVRAGSSART